MAMKAQLKVQLLANEVVVAESDSGELWQSVLRAMERDEPLKDEPRDEKHRARRVEVEVEDKPSKTRQQGGGAGRFAQELNLERDVLEGACSPSTDSPYIHLDKHHWAALRKNTGERGSTAITGVVLAGTLLVLWWKHAGKEGNPAVNDIAAVLETIGLPAANLKRTLGNCRWLQVRGSNLVLNPSRTPAAIAVARAYCLQESVAADD